MAGFTAEKIVQVYNDEVGSYIYVGPDADGLDLVEIRSYFSDGKIECGGNARITMPPEQAILVARAILELYSADH